MDGMLLKLLMMLLFLAGGIEAFVYSCDEVKYRLINSAFEFNATWVCIIPQERYKNWDQLENVRLALGDLDSGTGFATIAGYHRHCTRRGVDDPRLWKVVADTDFALDCDQFTQQFTLLITSDPPTTWEGSEPWKTISPLVSLVMQYRLKSQRMPFVVPYTGMWIHKLSCTGTGNVTVYAGAGSGENEERFALRSWSCESVPDWIFSFDNVITVETDQSVEYFVEYSADLYYEAPVAPGETVCILSSGRSDDLQNKWPGRNMAYMNFGDGFNETFYDVTVKLQLDLDPANKGHVSLWIPYDGPDSEFRSGTHAETYRIRRLWVLNKPTNKQPSEIWNSQDKIIIDISFDLPVSTTTPALTTTTHAPSPSSTTTTSTVTTSSLPKPPRKTPYCNCGVDKFGVPDGWNFNDIWLDIVVILDTSAAMGSQELEDAIALIESFIRDGCDDLLITDTNAPFYSRVGVISMSDTAEVLYNLNMTSKDRLRGKASIKKDVLEINVVDAFVAALMMFNEGLKSKPERASARQVVYYMTDSDPKNNLNGFNQFKASQGVIVVNNFLQEGEVGRPALKDLASPGYYLSKDSYKLALQSFCKANCFCKSDKNAYAMEDPAIRAAGGCYHPAPVAVSFNEAKSTCASQGGSLVTIHDEKKGQFLQQLMSNSFFWIGYEKSDEGIWNWLDQSNDTYANWAKNEPSAVAKCAYADTTTAVLKMAAGDCPAGLFYICQYAPCAAGNKNC